MILRSLLLIFGMATLGCQSDADISDDGTSLEFDSERWAIVEDEAYPYRNRMLEDLLQSDTIKKLNRSEILKLLGKPTRTDSNYLFYKIEQELLANFFPLHTKTMVIKMKNDSAVEWVKIHE